MHTTEHHSKHRRPRKRWTFLSTATYLTERCNGDAHVHLNPAGAARLMTWAVRRVNAPPALGEPAPGEPWREDQERDPRCEVCGLTPGCAC